MFYLYNPKIIFWILKNSKIILNNFWILIVKI